MAAAQMENLMDWVSAQLAQGGGPLVVAIDGRCGSGKTTLAAALAEHFPASLTLHMDDFYLPLGQRAPDWENTPCANMDLDRFLAEALAPARAGQTVRYRAYSCARGALEPERLLAPQPLVLVEGSYSHHPKLAGFYHHKIFVTCPAEEQARRLMAREGERYSNFARRWIPLEEEYFAAWQIPQKADRILDTGAEPLE